MIRRKIVVIACSMAVALIIGQWSGVHAFWNQQITETPGQYAFQLFGGSSEDSTLLTQIKEEAVRRNVAPIDAVHDRVWKAIPGYNGLEVDIDQTYQKALALKESQSSPTLSLNQIPYIYRQVKPKVQLEDLGALPIYRGNPAKKMVALMINVAWGNEYLIPMLDTLDAAKVKATFFLDGSWLNKNADLAKEIQKRGHQLENHAYSHPNMTQLTESRAVLEISRTKDLLKSSLNVDNRWFAPPSGDFNQRTVEQAAAQGLKTVLWTLDTVDWTKPSPQSIVSKIAKRTEPGTLILLHPTQSSRDALQGMIQAIHNKGLELGTIDETLSSDRIPAK
ncbi:polysaccharide deacetylase family protein [Paenibacillus shirakamiensis]